jgi:hypothetical protein
LVPAEAWAFFTQFESTAPLQETRGSTGSARPGPWPDLRRAPGGRTPVGVRPRALARRVHGIGNLAAATIDHVLDFSRAAVDSSHIRAMKGGPATGPSPVDRGKAGSKHHLIVEAHGIPLAAITTGGNRNDVTQLIPLIQAVPPIRGKRGQPLRRPKHLYADRGYDHEVYRDKARRFQITPHLARRGTGHGSGLGVYRWVVEGAIVLLHWFRRLRTAGRSGTTSTTRSSPSAAPSSAGDDSAPHFVGSKGRRCTPGDGLLNVPETHS